MSLHPRELTVQRAHAEAAQALIDLWERHDLTWGEIIAFHARELQTSAKYVIRTERHPNDPDKPGGEE